MDGDSSTINRAFMTSRSSLMGCPCHACVIVPFRSSSRASWPIHALAVNRFASYVGHTDLFHRALGKNAIGLKEFVRRRSSRDQLNRDSFSLEPIRIMANGMGCTSDLPGVESTGFSIAMRRGDILSTGRLMETTANASRRIASIPSRRRRNQYRLAFVEPRRTVVADGHHENTGQRLRMERRAIRSVARGRAIRVCVSIPR
ncbi:hypothetical protein OKW50_006139 [Paraburkholderia youngii]